MNKRKKKAKKKKEGKSNKEEKEKMWQKRKKGGKKKKEIFLAFRRSNLDGPRVKVDHTMKAMRGYQNLGVSSNSKR